jgi:hypothetical protein
MVWGSDPSQNLPRQLRHVQRRRNRDSGDHSQTGTGQTVRAVTAGLERAREGGTRSGKAIGRPRRVFDRAKAVKLREAGYSYPAIARMLNVGQGTAVRAVKAAQI